MVRGGYPWRWRGSATHLAVLELRGQPRGVSHICGDSTSNARVLTSKSAGMARPVSRAAHNYALPVVETICSLLEIAATDIRSSTRRVCRHIDGVVRGVVLVDDGGCFRWTSSRGNTMSITVKQASGVFGDIQVSVRIARARKAVAGGVRLPAIKSCTEMTLRCRCVDGDHRRRLCEHN